MAIRDSVTVSMAALTSGNVERDVAAQSGRDIGVGRNDGRFGREDENVVEGQAFLDLFVQHRSSFSSFFAFFACLGDHGPGLLGPLARRSALGLLVINRLLSPLLGKLLLDDRLDEEEIANGVLLDPVDHGLEHVEAFFLVLDEGIPLAVAAEPDALLEIVHARADGPSTGSR